MKNNQRSVLLPLLMIALLAMSCQKERDNYNPIGDTPLLEKITREGTTTPVETYEYNALRQVIKMREDTRPTAAISFTYSGGKPDKAEVKYDFETGIHYSYRFIYGADGIDKLYMYHGTDNANPRIVLKYNYQNKRVSNIVLYNEAIADDKITSRSIKEYYPNGDLRSNTVENREEDGSYSYYYSVEYEYDTRLNPMADRAVNMASFVNSSPHNVTKATYREGADHRISQIRMISYTYLRDTYPLTSTEVISYPNDPDVPTETSKYTYRYK